MTAEPEGTNLNAAPSPAAVGGIPVVVTGKSPEQIIAHLGQAARRGKLPGFSTDADDGALFIAEAFAAPFNADLVAHAKPGTDGMTTLTFTTRIRRKAPLIWLVILLLAIYPGYPLMESQIATILPAAYWEYTKWWYLPLAVISVPLVMLPGLRKSRAMAHLSAVEVVNFIAEEIGTNH